MAVRTVVRRIYRDGTIRYLPEGQKKHDTAATLERDGLIRRESDGFTVLDADNIRVVCWQIGANETIRARTGEEPFPGVSARVLNVIDHRGRRLQ